MSKLLISLVNIDAKSLLAIGAVFAIIAYVVSTRNEKLKGIPVVTDCGGDHERAMMEGALKVSSKVQYFDLMCALAKGACFLLVPQYSVRCGDSTALHDRTTMLL